MARQMYTCCIKVDNLFTSTFSRRPCPVCRSSSPACRNPEPIGLGAVGEGDFSCRPERPFPYADGVPYLGVHGDPANSDLIDCESASRFEAGWHALEGLGIPQPNTFSPDGATTYVTTTNPEADGCRVHALDVRTGESVWCRSYDPSVSAGSVEVDLDGHLYFTVAGALVSLDADGEERWRTSLPAGPGGAEDTAWGVHMSAAGHVVTVTTAGTVAVYDRDTGDPRSSLSIPETWGYPPVEALQLSVDPSALFPESIVENIESVFGPTDADSASSGIGAFLGAGAFVDNTVAISPRGEIYVIGAGPDRETGALVQIHMSDEDGTLTPGWVARTRLGGDDPIGERGWVVIGDGASMERFLNPMRRSGMSGLPISMPAMRTRRGYRPSGLCLRDLAGDGTGADGGRSGHCGGWHRVLLRTGPASVLRCAGDVVARPCPERNAGGRFPMAWTGPRSSP